MQPTLFEVPVLGLTIRSFGVMAMLAFLAGISFAIWRARDRDLPPPFLMDLGIFCLVSGIAGARLFFVVQEAEKYNWALFQVSDGGFSILGGILGGALPLLLYLIWTLTAVDPVEPAESDPNENGSAPSFSSGQLYGFIAVSLFSALIVSRIVYVYTHPDQYVQTEIPYAAGPFDFLKIWEGGIVFYGGLFGGMLGGTAFILWHGHRFLEVADLFAAPLLLAQSIARWGCFLVGDDFGTQVSKSFPLAVRFPKHEGETQAAIYYYQVQQGIIEAGAEYTTWVHPAQLYMSFGVFVALLILLLLERGKWFAGWSFGWMMVLYAIHRFIVEFWRGDPLPIYTFTPLPRMLRTFGFPQVQAGMNGPMHGLRISQLVSVFLLVGALLWLGICWWLDRPDRSRASTG